MLVVVSFAMTGTVFAFDCSDDVNNETATSNCDFDTDVAGWTMGFGTISYDNTDDFKSQQPASGSALLTATPSLMSVDLSFARCFNITPATLSRVGGVWLKHKSGASASCLMIANYFDGANCSSNVTQYIGSWVPFNSGGPWTNFYAPTSAANSSFVSAQLNLACSSTVPFSISMDNAYIVPDNGSLPVELQTFSVD